MVGYYDLIEDHNLIFPPWTLLELIPKNEFNELGKKTVSNNKPKKKN